MVEALVLESFVTAVACLCASSYGPNVRPENNLKDIIANELTGWDRDVLQILVNSNKKFSLHNKFGNCELPDQDALDERLIDLEYETDRQKRHTKQLSEELERLRENCDRKGAKLFVYDEEEKNKLREELSILRKFHDELRADVTATHKENEILKRQQESYKTKLENVRAENKDFEKQIADLNSQIDKLKTMTPPNLRSLKNNCLMATESGVANLELRIKEDLYCAKELDAKFGDGWILVAQRFDGSEDFNRTWIEYVQGFGAYGNQNEFFAGLDRIYALSQNSSQELLIVLTDNKNETRFAHYADFAITGEKQAYALNSLGKFYGDAGDALTKHLKQKFATFDKDNESQCAKKYSSGWWYLPNNCLESNLFGLYRLNRVINNDTKMTGGMIWSTFHNSQDDGSLLSMRIYLKPKTVQVHIIIT